MTMNNRFLFRVWDKGERKMLYEDLDAYCNSDKGMCLCDSNCVLMQCTGLTAAKSYRGESETDKLIFEGDIVKIGYLKYKVIWDYAQYEFEIISDKDCCYPYFRNNAPMCEIIGTVHDNPELLEVGND